MWKHLEPHEYKQSLRVSLYIRLSLSHSLLLSLILLSDTYSGNHKRYDYLPFSRITSFSQVNYVSCCVTIKCIFTYLIKMFLHPFQHWILEPRKSIDLSEVLPIFDLPLTECLHCVSAAATDATERELKVYWQNYSCLGSLRIQHLAQQVTDQSQTGRANVCEQGKPEVLCR